MFRPRRRAALAQLLRAHVVADGESAWTIANEHGVGLAALQDANVGLDFAALQPGQLLQLPVQFEAPLTGEGLEGGKGGAA